MAEPTISDIDRRIAVLEQIAQDTATALADIRGNLRGLRGDFRWLLMISGSGFVGTWALLALHWF